MTDPFSSASGQARLDNYVGKLALFSPSHVRTGIKTQFGEIDGVAGRVVILDADGGEVVLDHFTILNAPVVQELKAVLSGDKPMHLARVVQVANKKGPKPIICLDPPSDEDKAMARAYLERSKPQDPFA